MTTSETMRSLYVCRPLHNVDALRAWATTQGLSSTISDMHVTVVFSRRPILWSWFSPDETMLTVTGGDRSIAMFDRNALVLRFDAPDLHGRWQHFRDAGASWDFPIYHPHLTLSYQAIPDRAITPYTGALVFGAERFAELDDQWAEKISEIDLAVVRT